MPEDYREEAAVRRQLDFCNALTVPDKIIDMDLTPDLKAYIRSSGADLTGIADLKPFKNGWVVVPEDILNPYAYAVSIAKKLDDGIINTIIDGPTPEYAGHYRDVNAALDAISARTAVWITEKGYKARAIPASHIADDDNLLGNISHKAVARMAGIGWQGKSLLIVSPEYGPRIRLATILTDMPLSADGPVGNRCGRCMECVKACPASAIKNISTDSRYETREDAIYLNRCFNKVSEFKARPGIGALICGVCVKICPFGKKKSSRKRVAAARGLKDKDALIP